MKTILSATVIFLALFASSAFADAAFTMDKNARMVFSDGKSAAEHLVNAIEESTQENESISAHHVDILESGSFLAGDEYTEISTLENGVIAPAIKYNSSVIYIVGEPNSIKLQIAIFMMVALGNNPVSISGNKGFRKEAIRTMDSYGILSPNL